MAPKKLMPGPDSEVCACRFCTMLSMGSMSFCFMLTRPSLASRLSELQGQQTSQARPLLLCHLIVMPADPSTTSIACASYLKM